MARSPQMSLDPNADSPPDEHELHASLTKEPGGSSQAARLRAENEELRATIAELRQQLDDAGKPNQGSWEDREREFETILEEKSEEIRLLYMQIQERERKEEPAAPAPRTLVRGDDEEVNALAEDLANDKARLDEEREQVRVDREQIRQDEEDLEQRMQEMELQTAKSRAGLVQQRNELQRLYNEVRAELEQAKQGGAMSERVRNLEQEAQELSRAGRGR